MVVVVARIIKSVGYSIWNRFQTWRFYTKLSQDAVANGNVQSGMKDGTPEVTDLMGSFGRWQAFVLTFCILRGFSMAFNNLGYAFLAPPIDHWCAPPEGLAGLEHDLLANMSFEDWKAQAIPFDEKGHHSQCEMFAVSVDHGVLVFNHSRKIHCSRWKYYSPYFGSSVGEEWNLVCDRAWLKSLTQSIYMGGMFVGCFVYGHLSDRVGRRPSVFSGALIHIVSGVIASVVPSYWVFLVARFFTAVGLVGMTTSLTILMEAIGPGQRSYTLISFGLAWALGQMLLAGLAYVLQDWRYLHLTTTLFSLSMIAFWKILYESPRWLLTKGRYEQASKIMKKIRRLNRLDIADWDLKFDKLKAKYEMQTRTKSPTILSLLRPPKLRVWTLIIYFITFVTGFLYYAIALSVTKLAGNPYLNFIISASMDIISAFLCMLALNYCNRRKCTIFLHFAFGIIYIPLLFIQDKFWWITIIAMSGKFLLSSIIKIGFVYSTEIFPTSLRCLGNETKFMFYRLGAVTQPFIITLLATGPPVVKPLVYSVISVMAGVVVFFLPETYNKELPDTVTDTENINGDVKPTENHLKDLDSGNWNASFETENNGIQGDKLQCARL